MKSSNIATWFVVFLLALSTVLAAEDASTFRSTGPQFASLTEDFTATGTGRILAFACSPAEGQLTVTNIGDVPSTYFLSAEGTAKEWVLFVPDSFTLQPGQRQTVQEFFAIPCDASDEFLDIIVSTDELELVLTQDITVQTPNNIMLIPEVYAQAILPCDAADFTFVLHNPAEFPETYTLKVFDAPEQVAVSDDVLTLLPHTNETIAVTIRPKDCTMAGEFTPVLVVKTEKSAIAAEIEMFLRINDSDIPEIAEGIERIRAGFAPQEASLDIFNTGDRVTTYFLRVDGPLWVSIQPEDITVQPRDSETIKLVLQPTEGTPAGTYIVTVTARVAATGKEYTKDFTIKLGPPTFFEKLWTEYLPFTIAGIIGFIVLVILTVAGVKKYRSPEFQAKLAERRAERERRKQERLALKEAQRIERDEERKHEEELKRQKEEEDAKDAERRERELERERLKAQRDYDKQLRKEHLVIPKDDIVAGTKLPAKRVVKFLLLLVILALVGLALAFNSVIVQNAPAVLAGLIVLLIIMFLHRLRRRRMARGKWKLALANRVLHLPTLWKHGLTELTFKLNSVAEKLVVMAKRCTPTVPSPSENTYQTFVITANVENDFVANARIRFKVKKSWLMRHRVSPDGVKLLRLDNDRWVSIIAEPVSTDAAYVYYAADADGFGEFAIVGKPGKKPGHKREYHLGRIIAAVVFGLALIAGGISLLLVLPESQTEKVGIPAQVWKQDTQHILELGNYFKDPDGDQLTFAATRTEHIDITFVGSKAILTPEHGWTGRERTVFIADDGKGGLVRSNPVDLVIEKPIIPSFVRRNATTILTVAALVVIVLGIALFRKQLKKIVGLDE